MIIKNVGLAKKMLDIMDLNANVHIRFVEDIEWQRIMNVLMILKRKVLSY